MIEKYLNLCDPNKIEFEVWWERIM